MDFDTLIFFVIAGVYILFQVLGAKKKQQQKAAAKAKLPAPKPVPPGAAPTSAQAEPTLDDALREIRLALGMATPPKPPRPVPHAGRTHAPELIDAAPEASWATEFKERPKHYADADFEALPAHSDRFRRPQPRHLIATEAPTAPATDEPSVANEVLNELQSAEAARKAFILGEILGPPRSMR